MSACRRHGLGIKGALKYIVVFYFSGRVLCNGGGEFQGWWVGWEAHTWADAKVAITLVECRARASSWSRARGPSEHPWTTLIALPRWRLNCER